MLQSLRRQHCNGRLAERATVARHREAVRAVLETQSVFCLHTSKAKRHCGSPNTQHGALPQHEAVYVLICIIYSPPCSPAGSKGRWQPVHQAKQLLTRMCGCITSPTRNAHFIQRFPNKTVANAGGTPHAGEEEQLPTCDGAAASCRARRLALREVNWHGLLISS